MQYMLSVHANPSSDDAATILTASFGREATAIRLHENLLSRFAFCEAI